MRGVVNCKPSIFVYGLYKFMGSVNLRVINYNCRQIYADIICAFRRSLKTTGFFGQNGKFVDAVCCSTVPRGRFPRSLFRPFGACLLWWQRHRRPKSRWTTYNGGMSLAPISRISGSFFCFGFQWNRKLFAGFGGKGLSKPSVFGLCNRQKTTIHPTPEYRPSLLEATSVRSEEAIGLFFIQLSAVWWLMPKVRPRPLEEERSCAARITVSLKSPDFRRVSKTPPKPHSLHLYLGLPELLLPLRTIWGDWHLPHLLCSIIIVFFAKISITR